MKKTLLDSYIYTCLRVKKCENVSLSIVSDFVQYCGQWQHIKKKKQRHYFANKCSSSQRHGFSTSHVWMWESDYKEGWVPKNWCFWTVVLEKTLESPLDCKEIQPVLNTHWKDWCWNWNSNTLVIWCEELTHWKRPCCWERLKVGGEGDYRGWDGWMASPTQWTRVWINSRVGDGQGGLSCCSPWGHRVRQDWATELNWTHVWYQEPFKKCLSSAYYVSSGTVWQLEIWWWT